MNKKQIKEGYKISEVQMINPKLKRTLCLTSVLLGICLMISSCTPASTPSPTSIPEVEEDTNLPSVTLENKKVSIFIGSDNLDDYRSSNPEHPGWVEFAEEKYGLEIELVAFTDYSRKNTVLTALYMSDEMPDYISAAEFPIALANNFLQPADQYIDFSNPIWDDVRFMMDSMKWKEKTYHIVTEPLQFNNWLVWNPELFEANNVTSPLEYFDNDTWTWEVLKELAVEMTQDTDSDGQNDIWGLGLDGAVYPLHFSTGVNLLSVNPAGGFDLNFNNEKITAAANFFGTLGPLGENILRIAGTGAMTTEELVDEFVNDKVALYAMASYQGGWPAVIDKWEAGTIDFCLLPQWMGEGKYYTYAQPATSGISSKAKNPEAAALIAQLTKYTSSQLYKDKYLMEDTGISALQDSAFKTEWKMTDAQLERILKCQDIARESPGIPFFYYTFWGFDDGFFDMLTNNSWSQAVERITPIAQTAIDDWMYKLNKIE